MMSSGPSAPGPPPPPQQQPAPHNEQPAANPSVTTSDAPRPSKRPLALNGISSTVEERSKELLCPVCFDLIREAHVTRCGHTFCYECIVTSIDTIARCPKCNAPINSISYIFPNYLLSELITKHKHRQRTREQLLQGRKHNGIDRDSATFSATGDFLKQFITTESEKLELSDVDVMLRILSQRKKVLEADSTQSQNRLLHDFLGHLLRQKMTESETIAQQISLIQSDMAEVEEILAGPNDSELVPSTPPPQQQQPPPIEPTAEDALKDAMEIPPTSSEEAFNSLYTTELPSVIYLSRKRRMYAHFDDFATSYFAERNPSIYQQTEVPAADSAKNNQAGTGTPRRQGLDVFRENIVKFSRYNSLRPLASMHYSSDLQTSSTIVSSIVFDKDNEYFAIGGVTKRIKVFDYMAVVRDTVDIHYPNVEMTSNSKISCIAWNSYHKNIMASSDYEGIVSIWDVNTGTRTQNLHEHEKRCWSVDFNEVDTRLIASGSDDSRVKLWSTNDDRSIATLEAKANVCCVKFNPKSSCHLAFGSADHDVHYYDLRNMSKALNVFKGHKKAVSYVKFLNTEEIISASTDSQLKLWNVNRTHDCVRSFTGHTNEKNFVGLATDGDYVACGSEDNAVYVYYKGLSKQLFHYNIDGGINVTLVGKQLETSEFVSAVCWRRDCNVVVAANSKGLIKVFELV